MKVILAGGGTGGHLYPNIAIAQKLEEIGIDFLFLVSNRGIENKILTPLGYQFIEQNLSGFSNASLFSKLKSLKSAFSETLKVSKHINKYDILFVTGGFATIPALIVAIIKRCRIYVHEQNSVIGLANAFAAKFSKIFFTSYYNTANKPKNAVFVGNPIRSIFLQGGLKSQNSKRILILGGSQGSKVINTIMVDIVCELISEGYEVTHQTGEKLYEYTLSLYGNIVNKNLTVVPYIDDMKGAYDYADIVISRSGSGAVHEITASKRPALYIPFAAASGNHQYYNALEMKNKGYCEIIEESDISALRLKDFIYRMFKNIDEYKGYLASYVPLDSASMIIEKMNLNGVNK